MMIAVYIIVIIALLLFPEISAQSARDALNVWGLHVAPSLFPYMVFSKLLAERMQNTRFPPATVCALLGAIGGSPSGASLVASSMHRLSMKAVRSLCAFTGSISPMFFLGTVRGWTSDPALPNQLYLSQFLGAALAALCVFFLPASGISRQETSAIHGRNKEISPLAQSIDAILQIGGCIICFSVLASLLSIIPIPDTASSVIHGFLEISGGVHALMYSNLPQSTMRLVLAFVSGFGGLSILFQNLLFLKPFGIQIDMLLFLSLLRGLFSAAIMLAFIAF